MHILSPQEVTRRRQRGLLLQQGNPSAAPEAPFAVLSSFNADLLSAYLSEGLERIGLYSRVYLGDFGQLAQEILDPSSGLYRFQPEGAVLIPAVEDLLAPLFASPLDMSREESAALAEESADELERLVRVLLDRLPSVSCYVVAFGTDRAPMPHILDPKAPGRGQAAVERLLDRVRGLRALSPRVAVVDWDWHIRATGTDIYRDERLWYLGRMRLNPLGAATLAQLIAQYVAADRGMVRKAIAVDLDNTLWGGVVGEAGLSGLVLGQEGLGLAFQEFQRELRRLRDAGVVLTICSKNNPEDAREVFDRHPEMVLRWEHFAAVRINWQDKATNLVELGEELNLGLDSFVFLDDNPVERQWVREKLPQVEVPELPEGVSYRPVFLRRLGHFQRIAVTDADVRRAETYTAQGLRRQLRESTTMEEFLASLQQEVRIEPVHEVTLARAAQLCQRTNQFNLTTHRHTLTDIDRMHKDPAIELYTVAVKDRYGDNGITGLSILRFEGDSAEVDTFLLSCRVLGRKVEDVFLAFLEDRARARGVRHLIGRYRPTEKNSQVARFYPDREFERIDDDVFCLDLKVQQRRSPPPIDVKVLVER